VEEKARVGFLTLMFDLYERLPGLEEELSAFGSDLARILAEFCDVSWPGVLKTQRDVDRAVTGFEEASDDLILVVFLAYAPSAIVLPSLRKTPLPVVIFDTQRLYEVSRSIGAKDLLRNHGMHGVQDLSNALTRAGRPFNIVVGHYADSEALGQMKEWCEAARIKRFLSHAKVGSIGGPLVGMTDLTFDEESLRRIIGAQVCPISQKEIAMMASEAPDPVIEEQMARDRRSFKVAPDITDTEHEESSRLEWAIRNLMERERIDAFTANFVEISEGGLIKTLPFLASSKMLAEGFGYAGEGDALTSLAVAMMHRLAGSANFTEMFTMDFKGDAILMSHMGEGNPSMARLDEPVELVGSDLGLVKITTRPLLLRFSLRPGHVTLVNFAASFDGLKLIASEGDVLDFPAIPGVKTPHFKFRPERPLKVFLSHLSMEGSSHHFALAYGSWSSVMRKIATLTKIGFAKI